MIGLPRAELVFTAQKVIYSTLLNVSELITSVAMPEGPNASTKRLGSTSWHKNGARGFATDASAILSSVLSVRTYSSQVPQDHLSTVCNNVVQRQEESSAHLEFLQCDDAFARLYARGARGESSPPSADKLAERFETTIAGDIMSCFMWTELRCLIDSSHASSTRATSAEQPLGARFDPLNVMKGYLTFALLHLCSVQSLLPYLRAGRFSQYWPREVSGTEGESNTSVMPKLRKDVNLEQLRDDDPIFWCLWNIVNMANQTVQHMMPAFLEMLDQLMNDPAYRKQTNLDPALLRRISDIVGVQQLKQLIELSRPYITGSVGSASMAKFLQRHYPSYMAGRTPQQYPLGSGPLKSLGQDIQQAIGPDCRDFYQKFMSLDPPQDRTGAKWKAFKEESNLRMSSFWMTLKENVISSNTLGVDLTKQSMLQILSMTETESYKEKVSTQLSDIETRIQKEQEATRVLPSHLARSSKTDSDTSKPKADEPTSTKKRRAGGEELSEKLKETSLADESHDRHDANATEPSTISTTKRALEVMALLFPSPGADTRKQSTTWDQFVRGMRDIGFEINNCGGSVVSFELYETIPVESGSSEEPKKIAKGKVSFHRPHPTPKMDEIMLRCIGKRLAKHFGFTRETFVLSSENR